MRAMSPDSARRPRLPVRPEQSRVAGFRATFPAPGGTRRTRAHRLPVPRRIANRTVPRHVTRGSSRRSPAVDALTETTSAVHRARNPLWGAYLALSRLFQRLFRAQLKTAGSEVESERSQHVGDWSFPLAVGQADADGHPRLAGWQIASLGRAWNRDIAEVIVPGRWPFHKHVNETIGRGIQSSAGRQVMDSQVAGNHFLDF